MGLSYDEFLDFTPVEFRTKTEAYIHKFKFKNEEIITQAWLTAALVKTAIVCAFEKEAKFPALNELLEAKPKEEQKPEDMEAVVRLINAAFGGNVVEMEG